MRPDELVELLRTKPFNPLRITMTDGKTYDIRHPDLVMVSRGRVDIGVPMEPGGYVMERVEHCSLLHIVRVEPIAGAAASPGSEASNGAA